MNKKIIYFLIVVALIIFLNNVINFCDFSKTETTNNFISSSRTNSGYKDDTYCADLNYYNPSTGYRNTYKLNIDVSGDKVVKIWFSKGWLDHDQFSPQALDSNGECEIICYDGVEYYVHINGPKCNYTDDIVSTENLYKEKSFCPECGELKDGNKLLCNSCIDKTECTICGLIKFPFEEFCSRCLYDKGKGYECSACGKQERYLSYFSTTCVDCFDKKNQQK